MNFLIILIKKHRTTIFGNCIFTLVLFTLSVSACLAQTYITEGKNRYTFAQSTFGYDMEYTPATGVSYYRDAANNLVKSNFGRSFSPTICITGLHFWGHAEFFTGFSVKNIEINRNKEIGSYSRSGATGGKYFPWAIKTNKFRPFLGLSVASFKFQQSKGVELRRVDFPVLLGMTYAFKRGILELGCNYHPVNRYDYFISKSEIVPVTIPQFSFSIDYKYFFDLSLNSINREKRGELKQEYEFLKAHKSLSSISIGIGPAYSFFLGESSYNIKYRPYLDDHQISNIFPDIGLGYYNYKLDATANLSWRSFRNTIAAYDISQTVSRNSFSLEVFKFLGDYHGFVPFVGIIASNEKYRINEQEHGYEVNNRDFDFFTGGIIAGWDIRSTRTDWWSVRTNIRYFPQMKLDLKSGTSINMQQIELNFLQMILYPNRIITQLNRKK